MFHKKLNFESSLESNRISFNQIPSFLLKTISQGGRKLSEKILLKEEKDQKEEVKENKMANSISESAYRQMQINFERE